jgi:hypothetical protein
LFHRGAPGAVAPARSEVKAALEASVGWAKARDLPDPAAHADFVAHAELFHERLIERARLDRFPLAADKFPLPKEKGGVRQMLWMDPYDDIALRVLIGRASPAMRKACSDDVFSYRFTSVGAGWQTLDHKEANGKRRDLGLALLHDPRCRALGTLDVTNYYPTIDLELLKTQLVDVGAPRGAVDVLCTALRTVAEDSRTAGLPIGFEGSGPLGSAYLLPADGVHALGRVGLIRYTDDTWLFLRSVDEWEAARDEYVSLLRDLGLALNEDKSRVYDAVWDFPEEVISHGAIAYVTEGGSRTVTADEAADMLGDAVDAKDWTAIRFCLTTLKRTSDARGVRILSEHDGVFDMVAGNATDYLVVLARSSMARRKIDPEWLLGLATRPGDQRTLAGQLHACRALAALDTSKEVGRKLYELAFNPREQQQRVPLQTWAATAWASSKHWKASRAIDGVRDKGSLSVRRAFVLGCAARTLSKSDAKHVKGTSKVEPDLIPTIEFALAT